jgi:LemA protein
MRLLPSALLLLLAGLGLAGCGSGKLQEQEDAVKLTWAEATHQYQRRADLIPELLAKVQDFAALDATTLPRLIEARDSAIANPVTPALLNDTAAFARAQAAQSQLAVRLMALLAAADQHAGLASDPGYRDLRAQVHDIERRIAHAHSRYAEAVQVYNASVRKFPTSITAGLFDFDSKPSLAREAGDPKVASGAPEGPQPLASN